MFAAEIGFSMFACVWLHLSVDASSILAEEK